MNIKITNITKFGNNWLGMRYYSVGFSEIEELKRILDIKFMPFSIKIEYSPADSCFKIGLFNKYYIGLSFGLLTIKKDH